KIATEQKIKISAMQIFFAHEKTYIKKGKININFQKYKNQPHQD
ncbi:hypothetical protein SEEE0816_03416, partial [Salmonella enterica subsp. enterica serovar Enteritidis str. 607308-16]